MSEVKGRKKANQFPLKSYVEREYLGTRRGKGHKRDNIEETKRENEEKDTRQISKMKEEGRKSNESEGKGRERKEDK